MTLPIVDSLPNMRAVRLVQLLEVVVLEGNGVAGDPFREVTYYFTPDGTEVANTKPVDWQSA